MAIAGPRRIELVRTGELCLVKIARCVEHGDPVASLYLDAVPLEIALHLASRIDQRLGAEKLLDRRVDQILVVADLRL